MTSCCPPPRMRWSGATDAIARCKRVSTGCGRKPSSAHAWRWICGVKPKGQGATKPSTPYMRHGLPEVTRYPCYSLENREQAHQFTDTDQAISTPHNLFLQDETDARSGHRALHQSARVWASSLTWNQQI